jgi:hypothetical protein
MAYQTKIRSVRFAVGPFTGEQMAGIGEVLKDSILARIRSGLNAEDNPAKPLKPSVGKRQSYADRKRAKGLQPIRDWTWRGRTLRSMAVLSASPNRGVIGFTDAQTDVIAHINNQRERAFGVSPKDREKLIAAVREVQTGVAIVKVA